MHAPNYSAAADPLAGFHGPIKFLRGGRGEEAKAMEGEGTGGREDEGVGEEREGMSSFFPEPTCQP